MRDINECKAEIFRRSEAEILKRKKRRNRIIAYCIPLFFCATVLVYANLPNPSNEGKDIATEGLNESRPTFSLESFESTDEETDNVQTNCSVGADSDQTNDHSRNEEATDGTVSSDSAVTPETSTNSEQQEDETSEDCVSTSDSAVTPESPSGDETTLEFSITQNVKGYDWSEHSEIYGWMGARQFFGKGYEPVYEFSPSGEIISDEMKMPKFYVTYLVSAYPDYADGGEYVTEIRITDPSVNIYGLTTKSDIEDFDSVFTKLGYTVADGGTEAYPTRIATKGDISYIITKPIKSTDFIPEIIISAKVTNREGIEF